MPIEREEEFGEKLFKIGHLHCVNVNSILERAQRLPAQAIHDAAKPEESIVNAGCSID